MDIQKLINPTPDEPFNAAVNDGYLIVDADPPATDDLVIAARNELCVQTAIISDEKFSMLGLSGRGEKCEQLFHQGFDFSKIDYLTSLLGVPYCAAYKAIERAVVFTENPQPIPRARAKGYVIMWRAVDRTLDARNGFFKIVKGSHRMEEAEAMVAETIDVELKWDQVLIMDGDLWYEYSTSGYGLAQYKAIKKH